MYYYGLKLHALAFRRPNTIPFHEKLTFSSAEENDLSVLKKETADFLHNRDIYGDKIHSDFPFGNQKNKEQNLNMFTPIKAIKGESNEKRTTLFITAKAQRCR